MALLPSLGNLRGVLQRVIFVPIVYGFVSLLPVFLAGWENSDRLADRLFSTIRSKENMFDFIVVGGGTAGNLVANRLAEHYRVLLLEAGGTPSPFQTVPALALKFLNHPQTDWSFKTLPQRKACLNSVNQQASWSSGRGLGGTSNINFMAHTRGHPMDYESWAEDTGDPSWSYSRVLPYFKRYETFSGTSNDPESRGHDGELRIRKPNYIGLSEDWIRAGQELGYPFVDLNGRHEEGFGILQYPIYKGLRQTTYSALLLPMHKSPRLTIRRYALVRKVLFRDMNNLAYGVEYVRHGRIETAIATKEVILSAGTLGSSKLLLLSGVGPRGHLEELGIPVRSDLPVGKNLQDHLAVHLGPFFIKEPKSFLFDRDVTPENIVRFLFLGTGPITTTGYQGAASIASSRAKQNGQANWPDLHLILHGQAIHQGYVDAFSYAYGLQEDEILQYYSNAIGRDSFTIYVLNARPTSRGEVFLSGASINDPLVINPRYLEDRGDKDFKVLLEGVKTAMTIANTSMFQRLGTEFTNTKLPGCHDLQFLTDAYWECYIRRFTMSMHNPVGTAAMGHVVDSNLRVLRTRGLRVIDASIQPTVVSTGTFASSLMIAEKGVDMILKDHGIPDRDTDLFDVIFGKNGFFKRNPILRILQREFDTINPLRAIFKPFTSFTPKSPQESVAKERFTRNGRIDNPFLQVISTFFGSANRQGDNSASGSAYVDHFERNLGESSEKSLHLNKRSEDNNPRGSDEDDKNNVISKNQWVLQNNPPNGNLFEDKFIFTPSAKSSQAGQRLTLKITEVSTTPKPVKGKGGRRFALLQALLKEAALNETRSAKKITTQRTPIATIPRTTQVTPTQIITATLTSTSKPIVEIVKFDKPIVNSVENEIPVDAKPDKAKSLNSIKNSTSLGNGIGAKPVEVIPHSVVGLLPVNNNNIFNANQRPFEQKKNDPLSVLLQSLKTFQDFMNALTAKDRLPIAPSSSEGLAVSPTLNWFHNSNNFFANLFNTNKNQKPVGNVDIGFGKIVTNKTNNINPNLNNPFNYKSNSSNPFDFLFGNNSTQNTNNRSITTPASKPILVTEPIIERITSSLSSSSSSEEKNSTNSNTKTVKKSANNNDIFSSWFKPLTTSKPIIDSSSWFKPFEKPANSQPSSSSWFKPFASNINNDKQDSWIKPIDTKSWLKSTNDKSTTSSWFQPFSTPAPASASAALKKSETKNSLDHLTDLFELFFGGLKKQERREVFKTLNTMVEASRGIADLLGSGSNGGITTIGKAITTASQSLDFFKQLSKAKSDEDSNSSSNSSGDDAQQNNISEDINGSNKSDASKSTENYDNFLRDLVALNKKMMAEKLKTKAASSPTRKVKPISEEIDEEFILDSLTTESSSVTDEEAVEVTTEVETTTMTISESQ